MNTSEGEDIRRQLAELIAKGKRALQRYYGSTDGFVKPETPVSELAGEPMARMNRMLGLLVSKWLVDYERLELNEVLALLEIVYGNRRDITRQWVIEAIDKGEYRLETDPEGNDFWMVFRDGKYRPL